MSFGFETITCVRLTKVISHLNSLHVTALNNASQPSLRILVLPRPVSIYSLYPTSLFTSCLQPPNKVGRLDVVCAFNPSNLSLCHTNPSHFNCFVVILSKDSFCSHTCSASNLWRFVWASPLQACCIDTHSSRRRSPPLYLWFGISNATSVGVFSFCLSHWSLTTKDSLPIQYSIHIFLYSQLTASRSSPHTFHFSSQSGDVLLTQN